MDPQAALAKPLTEREQQILLLLAEDLSDRAIAQRLTLAVSTVKWYVRQLYAKFGVENRSEAVQYAQALGLLGQATARSAPASTLPAPVIPFIGREREIAELERLLRDPGQRLITLLGPGGIGKTSLAVEVARRQAGRFADGVYVVPLAPLTSADDLIAAIAKALDIQFRQQEEPGLQVLDYLRAKSACLVLDNFEHMRASVGFVTEMLHAAPRLRLIVTSREALGALGETRYTLHGLTLPSGLEPLHDNSSVRLFLQSAQRAQPGFAPSADSMAVIAEIARRVSGMPLALLLAGAWIAMLSVTEVCAEIEGNGDFLAGDSLGVPERHQSMRAVFSSTWNQLTGDERAVFAKVSMFRGGFDREAAQDVAGATLLILKGLVNKSLVQYHPATQRYDVHELLRQYGDEQLRAYQSDHRQRHAAYYTALAQRADQGVSSDEQARWVQRLSEEQDNFRAALRWLLQNHAVELALQLADALWGLWLILGYITEGKRWLEAALAQSDAALQQGTVMPAHLKSRANVLLTLGYSHFHIAEHHGAIARFEQAYELQRELANERGQIDARIAIGLVSRSLPDTRNAVPYLEESLTRARAIQYHFGTYRALHFLAGWHLDQGDLACAEVLLGQSLPLAREQGDLWSQGFMLLDLARVRFVRGDYAGAESAYRETLTTHAPLGRIFAIQNSFVGLGCLAIATHEPAKRIATLFGVAEAICQGLGTNLDITAIMRDEQYAAYVQERRGESAFASAWANGAAMGLEEAIEYALQSSAA
jgi:predicted ATPase/DNA-binding CsgD family transcriptional regulator